MDVVVQARLEHGLWAGWADVLLRVPGQSAFGDWRYEPLETKLATETRGTTLLQFCSLRGTLDRNPRCGTRILKGCQTGYQILRPSFIALPNSAAYFRLVRRNFERAMTQPLPASPAITNTYPEPVAHCDVCSWHSQCRQRWTQDDSVCLVAGVQKMHRKELADLGVTKLEQFARLPLPFTTKPRRGSVTTLERFHKQAELQLAARTQAKPPYELLKNRSRTRLRLATTALTA